MLTERLQVLIDREHRQRLEQEAASRGTSVAALVREAIDLVYPTTGAERRSAAERLLGAEPMDVPDVAELRHELDALRAQRR